MKKQLIILIIIFTFLAVLLGKLFFNNSAPNKFLFVYGALVTLVALTVFTVKYVKYKDPYLEAQKIPKSKKKNYFATCLVAVRNEEEIISKCVESFLNQTYKNKEIIFINDASTDNTKEILEKYAKDGSIKLINLDKNVGKKKALAEGIKKAKGEIFVFSDSDSVLDPDAIEKAIDVFHVDPLIGAVNGHCRALNAEENILTKIQDVWYDGQFSIRKAFESVYGCVSCVSGPLALFRKEAIYNFIPAWTNDKFLGEEFKFATDRTLTGFVLGSKYIGKKLKEKYADSPFVKEKDYALRDWKVVYTPSARVYTIVPDTFSKLIKQQIRWKKSFIRNTFFTGTFFWRKNIVPAFLYYAHLLFVIAGPFVAFRHLIYLPLQGNIMSAFLYISGILLMGFAFAFVYKIENKNDSKWVYRPVMNLMSTLVLSWLLIYAAIRIRNSTWSRSSSMGKSKLIKEHVKEYSIKPLHSYEKGG